MTMHERTFEVRTVSHELTREETVNQIADALAHLDQISEAIFARIGNSIGLMRHNIRSLDARVDLVDLKVNKIKGSKKAIKIFSSAKYPPDAQLAVGDHWRNIFAPHSAAADDDDDQHAHEYRPKAHKYTMAYAPLDEAALKDKYKEIGVTMSAKAFKSPSTGLGQPEAMSALSGLGSVLSDRIESSTSLLLFNTAQHPYKPSQVGASTSSAKAAAKASKRADEANDDEDDIYDAPQSILRGEQLVAMKREDIGFKPVLGDVPDFDVPSFLPELSGVADDIAYSEELPSIAPSNLIINDLPDILPDIAPSASSASSQQKTASSSNAPQRTFASNNTPFFLFLFLSVCLSVSKSKESYRSHHRRFSIFFI